VGGDCMRCARCLRQSCGTAARAGGIRRGAQSVKAPAGTETTTLDVTVPRCVRQAVLIEPGRLEIREVTLPHPGPGEVLLQIKCAMTRGTDLKAYRRGHPLWRLPTPFGHEFAGVVVEIGTDVEHFRPGEALMAAPTAPCGECFYCGRGQENLCHQAI